MQASTPTFIDWVLVNGLLCRTAEARDAMIAFVKSKGEAPDVVPVPRDARGGRILNINDPMEQ